MNMFSSETCLNEKQRFIFQHIVHMHLNVYPTYKQVSERFRQKTMLAAVQAIDERISVSQTNFCPPSIIGP